MTVSSPNQQLAVFLSITGSTLSTVVRRAEIYVPPYLAPLLQPAWKELGRDFGEAERAIPRLPVDQLRRRGLDGAQLAAKMQHLQTVHAAFVANPIKSILKKLLEAIDVLLDSLIALVPPLEPVKEFKDLISASVEL